MTLFDDRALQVLQILHKEGFGAWFVGGCVRDALMQKEFSDYDIATTANPKEGAVLFHEFELDLQGNKYGCLGVNNNGLWLEITTLREDTETDGRHAKVVFTDDIEKDAKRRDFTINALYWDGNQNFPEGLIDFFDGRNDLNNQLVKFIGDATQRVQEDYLRILRFFRFSSKYGQKFDKESLKACLYYQDGLQYLSGNRVWQEWSKTLLGNNTQAVLQTMADHDIDITLFGGKIDTQIYKAYQGNDALLLTLLLLPTVDVEHLVHRLNLTASQKDWLKIAVSIKAEHDFRFDYLYHGNQAKELVWYWACKHKTNCDDIFKQNFWDVENPNFPLSGKDIINLGCQPGPIVGDYLQRARQWWAQNNFQPSYQDCLNYVESILNN